MTVPKLLSKAWASNGLRNDIPVERSDGIPRESATYSEGFPQITMTPVAMGGKAPSGKDMNGVLNELSDHIVYQNKGGIYPFNAEFAEKIGGYPKGAMLINDRLNLAFQSLVDNNKTNFNTQDYSGKWVVVFGNDFFVPKTQTATTSRAGIVQLSNDDNSDDETKAPTLKAIKKLKGLYDAVTRNLGNYIPNSKKSNAVNSSSSDTIATSAAAKTAYDKAVEAKNAADNANNNANRRAFGLALSSEDLNNITASGIYGQNANINATPARHYPIQQAGMLIATESSGYGTQQLYVPYNAGYLYARGRNANNAWDDWKRIDGLDKVSKSGDTMTGNLTIDTVQPLLIGKKNGSNKYALGLRNGTSNDAIFVNYTYDTVLELLANSVYSNKTLVAPGMILEGSDWTGFNLKNLSGRYVRFEGNPHSAENMLTFVYREANGTNINTVSLRKKGGTIALLEDVRNINRRNYSRTIKGTAANWDRGTQKNINVSGYVVIYPDGKIEQYFYLRNFRIRWFDYELSRYDHLRIPEIPIQLWTAMPNKIEWVEAHISRTTDTNISPHLTVGAEGAEWAKPIWAFEKQGATKDRFSLYTRRIYGDHDEAIDMYVKVEGY